MPRTSKAAIDWSLRFGEHAEHLEELADDDPDNIPEALLIQPELPEHLIDVYAAFLALSRARPVGVGMGAVFLPIQVSEAIAMAHVIGMEPLDFLNVIEPADTLYVDTLNQRQKPK